MTNKDGIEEGQVAPDFSLKDQDGKVVSLKNFKGSDIVLYFYPKDDTPGCTMEACSFRDNMASLTKKGAVVLGVSNDDTESHVKFAKKYSLNFKLLSDVDRTVSKAYGVYQKRNMYGKDYWGIVRSTFIIGKDGRVRKAWRGVRVDGHTEEVLKAL